MKNKTLKTIGAATLSTAIAVAIQGCSADNPDSGSAGLANNISGIAVDGYLFNARVYVDLNNNAQRDPGEPSAITDRDGYFTTGKDGTDYCASDATELQSRHCLQAVYGDGDAVIRTSGGYDLYTGEPFDGSLSAQVSTLSGQPIASQMVSPLTTILTGQSDGDKATILGALGIAESDLERDFLDATDFDAPTVNAAIGLHKSVSIMSELLESNYDEIGRNSDFIESSNSLIYEELATLIADGNPLNNFALANAFAAAETRVRDSYTEEEITLPAPVSVVTRASKASNGNSILGLVDGVLDGTASSTNVGERVYAVELATRKILDDASATEINNTITEAGNTGSTLYTLLSGTTDGSKSIDFTALADTPISGATDYSGFDISAATDLTGLADQQISAVYSGDDITVSGGAVFFFNGEDAMATSGTVGLCLRYEDSNEVLEEETEGAYIEGDWTQIDDKRIVVTLAGGYDLTVISKGMDGADEVYSLSYAGDTVNWNSATGLIPDSSGVLVEPTTDAGCASLLSSS